MTRVNIYAADGYGDPGTELAGWFDINKAEAWTDANYDRTGHGEGIYRTAQGRWVLDGITGRCVYITPDEACKWLLASSKDEAVTKYFGPVEDERGPGRPEIGPPVLIRFGDDLLARVDAYATEHDIKRAEAVRRLVAAALA